MVSDWIVVGQYQAPLGITLSLFGSQPFCIAYKPFGRTEIAALTCAVAIAVSQQILLYLYHPAVSSGHTEDLYMFSVAIAVS
jgi:hypothetical protein